MCDKDEDQSVIIRKDDLIHTLTCKICNGCYCTFCYGCLNERMKNGLSSCPSCMISFDLFATGQTLPDHHLQTIVDHIRPYFTLTGNEIDRNDHINNDDTINNNSQTEETTLKLQAGSNNTPMTAIITTGTSTATATTSIS